MSYNRDDNPFKRLHDFYKAIEEGFKDVTVKDLIEATSPESKKRILPVDDDEKE